MSGIYKKTQNLQHHTAVQPNNDLLRLDDALLAEMSCVDCKKLLIPPIYHCERGHTSCAFCHGRNKLCKYCGSKNGKYRSYHVEKILNVLTSPCKHARHVCTKRFPLKKLTQHEEECTRFKMPCPFKEAPCNFTGNKDRILFHCQLVHSDFTMRLKSNFFKAKISHANFLSSLYPLEILPGIDKKTTTYFYSHQDNFFKNIVEINESKVILKIRHLGLPSEEMFNYEFKVELYNFDSVLVFSATSPCLKYKESENAINGIECDLKTFSSCRIVCLEYIESLNL